MKTFENESRLENKSNRYEGLNGRFFTWISRQCEDIPSLFLVAIVTTCLWYHPAAWGPSRGQSVFREAFLWSYIQAIMQQRIEDINLDGWHFLVLLFLGTTIICCWCSDYYRQRRRHCCCCEGDFVTRYSSHIKYERLFAHKAKGSQMLKTVSRKTTCPFDRWETAEFPRVERLRRLNFAIASFCPLTLPRGLFHWFWVISGFLCWMTYKERGCRQFNVASTFKDVQRGFLQHCLCNLDILWPIDAEWRLPGRWKSPLNSKGRKKSIDVSQFLWSKLL